MSAARPDVDAEAYEAGWARRPGGGVLLPLGVEALQELKGQVGPLAYGKLVGGGYTLRVHRDRLPPSERAAFDQKLGLSVEDR